MGGYRIREDFELGVEFGPDRLGAGVSVAAT